MARWRPRRTVKLHTQFLKAQPASSSPVHRRADKPVSRDLEDRWTLLHRHCADLSSHLRLGRLFHRLSHYDAGVQESAVAELELATQLIRTGVRVHFLPESQMRTADLECRVGRERFFVEVTAMVGSSQRRRSTMRRCEDEEIGLEEDRGVVLIQRILARIRQKAKQLSDYCDPVVLTISIPRADLRGGTSGRREEIWVDLKALSGEVTVLLTTLRHLSAVCISLWDVHPLPHKAGTRLANVEVAERSVQQRTLPRVRLLIYNPAASRFLREEQCDALRALL